MKHGILKYLRAIGVCLLTNKDDCVSHDSLGVRTIHVGTINLSILHVRPEDLRPPVLIGVCYSLSEIGRNRVLPKVNVNANIPLICLIPNLIIVAALEVNRVDVLSVGYQ